MIDHIKIGGIHLDGAAMLAPMSGITDAPFRRLAHRFGAGASVCEMVASRDLSIGKPTTLARALAGAPGAKLIVQLAGREAHWMGEGARLATDLGADIIDINMGCPAKKVTGGLSGSALMRDPQRALELIEAVVAATHVPVTLKMRLGWCDASLNAASLARQAQGAGVQMIAVHGRTRMQFYQGHADWHAIAKVAQAVEIPVIANGDLTDFADAPAMMRASRASGVMVGRGALGRPWFVGQVAALLKTGKPGLPPRDMGEIGAIVATHYEDMLSHYGRETGVRCARKHLGWYVARASTDMATKKQWRQRLCTQDDPAQVIQLIQQFYQVVGEAKAA
ncbi:MAG: tRNA dihydrouridine synthase DusB [Alphaproteobacteria bacterium]